MLDIGSAFEVVLYGSNPSRGKINTDKLRRREKVPTSACPALNAPVLTSLSSSPLGPNHGRLRATVIGPCEPFLTVSEPNPALLQPMIRTLLPPWPRS